MKLQDEKKVLICTYCIYALAILIMALILSGFTLLSRTALRSVCFFISYILEIILLVLLMIRQKIYKNNAMLILYVLLLIAFTVFTILFFIKHYESFMEGIYNFLK